MVIAVPASFWPLKPKAEACPPRRSGADVAQRVRFAAGCGLNRRGGNKAAPTVRVM